MNELETLYDTGPLSRVGSSRRWCGRHGRDYFLKEIPSHSVCPETDLVYQQLDQLDPSGYGLARPIRNRRGEFVSRVDGRNLLLLPWIDHVSCAEERIPLPEILRALSSFHAAARTLKLPPRPNRTYASYLRRGLERVSARFPGHPFCGVYRRFIEERLPQLRLTEGNLHFDLNPSNVWRDRADRIVFADFDDAQYGPYVKDVCEIASMDLDFEAEDFGFDASVTEGVAARDSRFLVLRPRLLEVEDAGDLDRFLPFVSSRDNEGGLT